MRLSLLAKTLLLLLLNLLVVGGVLFGFFAIQLHPSPRGPFSALTNGRIETVARLIAEDLRLTTPAEREAILKRYAETYQVEFLLFADSGEKLAGANIRIPTEVHDKITEPFRRNHPGLNGGPPPPPPDDERPPRPGDRQPPPPGAQERHGPPPDRPEFERGRRSNDEPRFPSPFALREVIFTIKTTDPTMYWTGVRIPLVERERMRPIRATLLASSDSVTGHGLFFNPYPWIGLVVTVFGLSVLIWLPFVRSLSTEIGRLTKATEQIAEERFDVRVNERRSDELGRLGKAVNHLAERLSNFVTGQKRFLGDVSHELNSPLARMQYALSILEEQVEEPLRPYVGDVQEDVRAMSELVGELLGYTRAGLQQNPPDLKPVAVEPVVRRIVERESGDATITVEIEDGLTVQAVEELLVRAVGNVVRNAVRYAGASGPIRISAKRRQRSAVICVEDRGPGVPESEMGKIFDPFYRVAPDRARNSGGVGLGLAIVKSSVTACNGTVSAMTNAPNGLVVEIVIPLAD
jgi:two-component system, OmpR family, sensor histidine kinase CpxA